MDPFVVDRPIGPWTITGGAEKLALRARLPGAYVFDRASHALRLAEAAEVPLVDRLSLAFPASWLVNAPAPSTAFRRWIDPPLRDAWVTLVEAVKGGGERWLAHGDDVRAEVSRALAAIRSVGQGDEAISKVLAILAPESAPLMPPESVAFVLGDSPGDAPFLAMLDWFSRAVLAVENELIVLARGHRACPLDAAQVLDRLLYFDSIGHRHFAK
jgi:hypothetical protein